MFRPTELSITFIVVSTVAMSRPSLCSEKNLTEMASKCRYVWDDSQAYPYPYNYNEWFKYLNLGAVRPLDALPSPRSLELRKEHMISRIFNRTFLLKDRQLLGGKGHHGDETRLHAVLYKLLQGKPITLVILGGSISSGGDVYLARNPVDSYFGQVVQWINETFPHPLHKFHKGTLPATGSAFFSVCTQDRVKHSDVDIVIVEFDVNDSNPSGHWEGAKYMDNPWRRGLEVLIRKLLQYPNRPAVLYMHIWMPGYDQHSFYNSTIEEETELLVKYYGLQSLSFRNAVYHNHAAGVEGFRTQDIACNSVHPTYLGHRYIADLLVGLMQDHLLQLIMKSNGSWHGNVQHHIGEMEQLPPPMIENNYESKTVCLTEETLKGSIVFAEGWEWVDEPNRSGSHRYGLVSTAVGSKLHFKVDTRNPHPSANNSGTTVGVGALFSYEHMGMFAVSCFSGCECSNPALVFNAHWKPRISSVSWVYLAVSQSKTCILQVINVDNSTSDGHKLKISGLSVLPFDARQHGQFANLKVQS